MQGRSLEERGGQAMIGSECWGARLDDRGLIRARR